MRIKSLNRLFNILLNAISSLYIKYIIKKAKLSRYLSQMLLKYSKLQKMNTY